MTDHVYDLLALAKKLAATKSHPTLKRAIEKAARPQACLMDLEMANRMIAMAEPIEEAVGAGRSEGDAQAQLMALLKSAVHLYCRATATAGKFGERGCVDIRHQLTTPEQLEDHDALVDVRNKALAHARLEQKIGGIQRHEVSVLLMQRDYLSEVVLRSSYSTFDTILFKRARRQVPVAIEKMTEKANERIAEISDLLAPVVNKREFFAMLMPCEVDPQPLFDGQAAAAFESVFGNGPPLRLSTIEKIGP